MLLSVIIPTYNRAAFLAPCVASVRACGVPAEIVVVDDGSTDDTAERVKDLGDVVYVRQANGGPAPARNNGVAHSRGRFLAFLDSDDSWRPGVVPRLLDALQKHPEVDVAFAETLVGNPTDGFKPLTPIVGEGTFDEIPCRRPAPGLRLLDREPFFVRMVKRNLVFLGSTVVRREAFDRLGGFDPGLFGGEDYEFVLRLAERGPYAYVDEPLAYYLKHPGTISDNHDRMDREYALVMQKVLEKCPGLSAAHRELVRRRRRTLMYYLGYNSYDRGDYPEARRRLRALFREFRPDAASLAVWAACQLPAGVLGRLRRLKQSLSGARPA